MPSSPPSHGRLSQILPTDDETPFSTPKFRPNSRRTPSFSSSSLSNSSDSSFESSPLFYSNASPPHTPITPPLNLIRVPFSWEQSPGIPKNHNKTEPSRLGRLLPLPPAGATTSAAKKWRTQEEITPKKHPTTRFKKDPFFAAMIECSKDDRDHDRDHDHDHGANIWKGSLSDRFGFISMCTSCKNTCAISESIVYVPRGRVTTPHYLLHR